MEKQTEIETFALPEPKGWKPKLRRFLYPADHCELPHAPSTFQDVLVSRVEVRLGWLARVRVLFSGRVGVEVKTVAEHLMGEVVANSAASVLPPRWMEDRLP